MSDEARELIGGMEARTNLPVTGVNMAEIESRGHGAVDRQTTGAMRVRADYMNDAVAVAFEALGRLARELGVGIDGNATAARVVVSTPGRWFHGPVSSQGILLDWDPETGYCRPRVVDYTDSAEEMLCPLKPGEDEPVDEAVADVFLPLPHHEWVPDI